MKSSDIYFSSCPISFHFKYSESLFPAEQVVPQIFELEVKKSTLPSPDYAYRMQRVLLLLLRPLTDCFHHKGNSRSP